MLILKIELVFEFRVSRWLEDLIDISRCDFIHILGCDDLLFFSVLLEHAIKQLGHTLRRLQLENSLRLLFLGYLLSFLIFFFRNSKTLLGRFDVEVLDPFDVLSGIRIGNTIEMLDRG